LYARSTSGSCRNSAIIKCCAEQCYTDLDLVVLIDSSGSINSADKANFDRVRNFTKAIVGSFELGENKTRVAIINYSKRAQVEISLLNGTSLQRVVKAIDEMTYLNSKLYSLHILRSSAF